MRDMNLKRGIGARSRKGASILPRAGKMESGGAKKKAGRVGTEHYRSVASELRLQQCP